MIFTDSSFAAGDQNERPFLGSWGMQKHVPPEERASARPKVTAALLFNSCATGSRSLREEDKIQPEERNFSMKAIRFFVLLLLTTILFAALPARADTYRWSNLQSDIAGAALHTDRDLVNPWGMAASSGGTIWVADNGTGVSTLYRQDGSKNSLVVTIPTSARNKDGGNPTGVVFNSTNFFKVTKNGNSQPARFIFVSEDGTISGWNPALDGTHAIAAVDNGTNEGSKRAIYKGAALGVANGHNFLYVTNFHAGRVETYNENFQPVNPGGFVDPNLPAGYAPFGIHNLNGQVYVAYALQDSKQHDEVAGPGNGFVDAFDTSGNFLRRVVSNGNLNAPWGLALVNGELWVGNFGDGRINNYNPTTGAFLETLTTADGTPLQFDGLWDLLPLGSGVYFTAGIADEAHGLFGIITED
jgi:uncharacterized protein (TIGR03118 family)